MTIFLKPDTGSSLEHARYRLINNVKVGIPIIEELRSGRADFSGVLRPANQAQIYNVCIRIYELNKTKKNRSLLFSPQSIKALIIVCKF